MIERWFSDRLSHAVIGFVDALLPVRCAMCAAIVVGQSGVCPTCWRGLSFITSPFCVTCGLPFDFNGQSPATGRPAKPGRPDSGGFRCGGCIAHQPTFRHARSVLRYDEASRRLILPFKHGDRPDIATILGPWMARAGGHLLEEADWMVPVPLHRWRLFARRYNQASRLAAWITGISGTPVLWQGLVRRRRTPSQGRFTTAGRRRNVAGAFEVPSWHRKQVADARILLVDDVLTTGATADSAARSLLRAGARSVDVLTAARVPLGA